MSTAARAPAGAGTRLGVQRALSAAALEPPGLPPAATLVVRSLADPLPGRMAPRPGDVRAPAAWESAVRGALAEQWRGAARPARGPVPAGAGAVYFADTAELIAAFARDAVAGDVARWWWRALLKGLPGGPVGALASLWAREARHVPAAVEQLAATGDAARVLAAFSPPQVARILATVAREWDAPALLAAPPPLPSGDAVRGSELTTLTTIPVDGDETDRPSAAAPPPNPRRAAIAPPWTGFLPPDAVPRGLAPEPAALLGLSLMLQRAPHVARGSAFVARFVRWRAEAAASPRAGARPSPAPPAAATPRDPSSAAPPALPDRDRLMEGGASQGIPAADEARAVRRDASQDAGPSADIHPSPAVPSSGSAERTGQEDSAPPVIHRNETADGAETVGWEVRIHEAPPEEARAASAACGVFYLVNVLRSLRFHRLLDEHFRVLPAVGGWGWIELVARGLLGPRAGGLADDPVWRLLAELDGRAPEERPGGGFIPPESDALPDAWIDLFGGHPPAPEPSPLLGMETRPELQRFLDLVIPVVRARTAAALRAAGGDPEEGLETLLIRRLGTVEATRTHVDVRMELDQATLPVRLAGLDATPGWVPELARVVTFYFV